MTFRFFNILLTVSLAALLAACASTVATKNLKQPIGIAPLTLTQDVVVSTNRDDSDQMILKAGTYRAEFQNAEGTYYRGPDFSNWLIISRNKPDARPARRHGGFWMATAPQAVPRFKIYNYQMPTLIEQPDGSLKRFSEIGGRGVDYVPNEAALPRTTSTGQILGSGLGSAIGNSIVTVMVEGLDKDIAVMPFELKAHRIEPFLNRN